MNRALYALFEVETMVDGTPHHQRAVVVDQLYSFLEAAHDDAQRGHAMELEDGGEAVEHGSVPSAVAACVPLITLTLSWSTVQQMADQDAAAFVVDVLLHQPRLAQRVAQLWVREALFAHFGEGRELRWSRDALWQRVQDGHLRVLLVLPRLEPERTLRSAVFAVAEGRVGSVGQLMEFEGKVVALSPVNITKSPPSTHPTHSNARVPGAP